MATPTLQIYSAIGFNPATGAGLSAAEFGARLAEAEATGEKRVAVRINSGGGDWQEGQTMYDLLKASSLKVDTYCVGLVASAATLPFMAGNKRLISAHAKLMIHNCASGAAGGIADLENAINQQKAVNASMAQLYATASGQTVEKCAELMAATTYMDAETAVALGFATGIVDDDKKALAPPSDMPTAELAGYYAALLPQPTNMKNLLLPIMAAAGLSTITAASPDADVALAVSAAFTERDKFKKDAEDARAAVAEATTKLTEAEAKLKDFEDQATANAATAAANAVTALVDGAVTSGRITASMKDTYTKLATADLASTTALIAALPAHKSLLHVVEADLGNAGVHTAGGAMLEIKAKLAGQ